MSWTIMFNEATFWEMLLRSSGNVYDYVGHIHNKFADLDGNSRISRPGWELVTLHNFVSPRSFNYTLKQWKKVIPILHTSLYFSQRRFQSPAKYLRWSFIFDVRESSEYVSPEYVNTSQEFPYISLVSLMINFYICFVCYIKSKNLHSPISFTFWLTSAMLASW